MSHPVGFQSWCNILLLTISKRSKLNPFSNPCIFYPDYPIQGHMEAILKVMGHKGATLDTYHREQSHTLTAYDVCLDWGRTGRRRQGSNLQQYCLYLPNNVFIANYVSVQSHIMFLCACWCELAGCFYPLNHSDHNAILLLEMLLVYMWRHQTFSMSAVDFQRTVLLPGFRLTLEK